MPDVIEAPYRPALLNEPKYGYKVMLGGPSCLAGISLESIILSLHPKLEIE